VRERADWQDLELAMWRDAAALDPGSDAALTAFHDEGVRVLEFAGRIRSLSQSFRVSVFALSSWRRSSAASSISLCRHSEAR